MTKVFISHSSKDRNFVESQLLPPLNNGGIETWYCKNDIHATEDWERSIRAALNECDWFLVVISKNSRDSRWVRREINWADKQRFGRIVPVVIDDIDASDFHLAISEIQHVNFFTDDSASRLLLDVWQDHKPVTMAKAEPSDVEISMGSLMSPDRHFVGRDQELAILDDALQNPKTNVVEFVAHGGVGKSTLVAYWMKRLAEAGWSNVQRVFGYSFYNQGMGDDAQASADSFLDSALDFFGAKDSTNVSPAEKGKRLAQLIRKQQTILFLDGVEPLQYASSSSDAGRIRDTGLAPLVKELALDNNGLCVITSRMVVEDIEWHRDIAGHQKPSVLLVELETLSPQAGAKLLHTLGVRGTNEELVQASEEVHGHGLALRLLGNYLREAWDGDVKARHGIGLLDRSADGVQGGQVGLMMAYYERWLSGEIIVDAQDSDARMSGPVSLEILRLMGLFDRPITTGELTALICEPQGAGLTAAIRDSTDDCLNLAISNLEKYSLLSRLLPEHRFSRDPSPTDSSAGSARVLDCHPLIRAHFADQLAKNYPDEAISGHRCLYKYLTKSVPDLPDCQSDLLRLYDAISHGCAAGLVKDALDEILWRRIQRGKLYFGSRQQGLNESHRSAMRCIDRASVQDNSLLNDSDKIFVCRELGYEHAQVGKLSESFPYYERYIRLCHSTENWPGFGESVVALSQSYLVLGDINSALDLCIRLESVGRKIGDEHLRIVSYIGLADVLLQMGALGESERAFDKSIKISYGSGFKVLLRQKLSRLFVKKDKTAIVHEDTAQTIAECIWRYCDLLFAKINSNELDVPQIEKTHKKIIRWCKRIEHAMTMYERSLIAVGYRELILSQVELSRHRFGLPADMDRGEQRMNDALECCQRVGYRFFMPRALQRRAAFARAQGDLDRAKQYLQESESICDQDKFVIWNIESLVERVHLELDLDNRGLAQEKLDRAENLVRETEQKFEPYPTARYDLDFPTHQVCVQVGDAIGYHRMNRDIAELRKRCKVT